VESVPCFRAHDTETTRCCNRRRWNAKAHREVLRSLLARLQARLPKFIRIRETLERDRIEALPYLEPEAWDRLTRAGDDFVMRWVDKQILAAQAVVVLIGRQTYARPLVRCEISKAAKLQRKMFGVNIRGLVDDDGGERGASENPFDYIVTGPKSVARALSRLQLGVLCRRRQTVCVAWLADGFRRRFRQLRTRFPD
jgi:MTH538 TIR-like domain (DUF1863)